MRQSKKNVEEQLCRDLKKNNKAFCLTVKGRKPVRDPDELIEVPNITCELREGKAGAEKLFALLFTAELFPCGPFISRGQAGGM